MIPILAHHVEAHHVVIMAILFAAGCGLGWQIVARLAPRKVG